MELPALLRRLENKVVLERELNRYFGTKSPDELLLKLRQLQRDGLLKYEVELSGEYFKWQRDHRDLLLRADVLTPVDPFGALNRDRYGLSVKGDAQLSEKEIIEVMSKLPSDIAKQHLRYRLSNIDQKKLLNLVAAELRTQNVDEDEFYDRVEWNGLAVDGVLVTYNGEPVDGFGFQHRQALRLLIKKKGKLCYKDEFSHAEAGIYNNPPTDHALRNLIYETRKALRTVTNMNCIKSTPSEGWYLDIQQ